MRRFSTLGFVLFFAVMLFAVNGAAEELATPSDSQSSGSQPWQLRFEYDQGELRLVEAARIPSIKKTIRTPGLELAPVKVGYDLTWLDGAGKSITATPVQVPLGIRSALGEG
ncbi:MAG: hypothetical protein GY867_06775, partial [bacterium]|nr:hypothetical protein [bacterium]